MSHRTSVLLVVVSSIGFSVNGLAVRLLDVATPLQAAFYRSAGMALGLLLVYAVIYRGEVVRFVFGVGWIGLSGSLLMAISVMTMVTAMFNATVANVVFVSSAIPFFTAALAWLLLGEKVSLAMMAFMGIAFGGVTVMVGGGISIGAGFGNLMAIISALGYALFTVVVRRRQDTNMAPMVALAGVWVCLGAALATGGDLAVPDNDLVLCLLWGAVIAGGGHSMFVLAARNLAGAEVTFLMLLEFVLAPVWVWLVVDEVPASTTIIGGILVMGALAGWTITRQRMASGLKAT